MQTLIGFRNPEKADALLRASIDTAMEAARADGLKGTPAEGIMMAFAQSSVHRAVITSHMQSGNTESTRAFFEKVRHRLGPTDDALSMAIDTMQASARARRTGLRVRSGSRHVEPADGVHDRQAAANRHAAVIRVNKAMNAGHPDRLHATEHELDIRWASRLQGIELAHRQLNQRMDAWLQGGGPNGAPATVRPPPELRNRLSDRRRSAADAALLHTALGEDVASDPTVWSEIRSGLANADPTVRRSWAGMALWEARSKLSNDDFAERVKLQRAAWEGDPNPCFAEIWGSDDRVRASFRHTEGAAAVAAVLCTVQDRTTTSGRAAGRKPSREQRQEIIDRSIDEYAHAMEVLQDDAARHGG